MHPKAEAERRQTARISIQLGVCPQCGAALVRPGYGSGSLADGLFCSLDCFGRFWYGSRNAKE